MAALAFFGAPIVWAADAFADWAGMGIGTWAGTWGVLGGTNVASAGIGAWLTSVFDKRDIDSISIVAHFHSANLTAGSLGHLDAFTIEPQDGNGNIVIHRGGHSWPGQMTVEPLADGIVHGNLSLSVHKDGHTHAHNGRWLAVDASEASKASADVQAAFHDLQTILGTEGEIGLDSVIKALEIIEKAQ